MFEGVRHFAFARGPDRLRRRVLRALALNRVGKSGTDELSLSHLSNHLEVQWRAREVHPWDRDLPPARVAQLFVEQCLDDTSAALERLFSALPEIDIIEFKVTHPASRASIVSGSVMRLEIQNAKACSSGMRLKQLGVTYRLHDWQFEPLV
jgi:hypothetical protein